MCVVCQNKPLIISKHLNNVSIKDADLSIRIANNKFIFTFEVFAMQNTDFQKDASRHRMCVLCCSRNIVDNKIVWLDSDEQSTKLLPCVVIEANKLCDRAMKLKAFL